MFCYKIHKKENNIILAVCDSELLGKKFEENNLQLFVKKDFYYENKTRDEIIKIFDKANIINLVGKRIIKLAEKNKWIKMKNVIIISGIPHAQIIKM